MIKDISNKIRVGVNTGVGEIRTVWASSKGRVAILTGGSLLAAVIAVLMVIQSASVTQKNHAGVTGRENSSSENSTQCFLRYCNRSCFIH